MPRFARLRNDAILGKGEKKREKLYEQIKEEAIEPAPKTVTISERIENVRFYKSSLSDGDVLESPCDLVILASIDVIFNFSTEYLL